MKTNITSAARTLLPPAMRNGLHDTNLMKMPPILHMQAHMAIISMAFLSFVIIKPPRESILENLHLGKEQIKNHLLMKVVDEIILIRLQLQSGRRLL
jgi:hypothetical protein